MTCIWHPSASTNTGAAAAAPPLDLISSSPTKFSHHLVYPQVVFRDNVTMGTFAAVVAAAIEASADPALRRLVVQDGGGAASIADLAVYTRNRNFRLFLSSKLGKGVPLQLAPCHTAGRARPGGRPTGQPASRPANRPAGQPASLPANRPACRPVGQPAGLGPGPFLKRGNDYPYLSQSYTQQYDGEEDDAQLPTSPTALTTAQLVAHFVILRCVLGLGE